MVGVFDGLGFLDFDCVLDFCSVGVLAYAVDAEIMASLSSLGLLMWMERRSVGDDQLESSLVLWDWTFGSLV